MTVAELTTIRTNVMAALNGTLAAGVQAYGINGRNLTKLSIAELWKMLAQVDSMIARAAPTSGGGFSATQFRDPE